MVLRFNKKRYTVLAFSFIASISIFLNLSELHASHDDSVSDGAFRIIRRFERFEPAVYRDSAGHPTIGYGHLITSSDGALASRRLTEGEAQRLLITDMKTKANIQPLLSVRLQPHQHDALTSLCFNIGLGNFRGATVLQKVNANDMLEACEYFGHWRKAGGAVSRGLMKRRIAEMLIFVGRGLDPNTSTVPSVQWRIASMPITDENWGHLSIALRREAVEIYNEYMSE